MSGTNLGTLQTLTYSNLQQFIDDVNRNFAVVQNSPLFKGIPGDEGEDGELGPQGIRGSKFIFVDFVKFQSIFTNEIATSTQIDLIFLNSKLSTNDNKNLLLTALGVPFLVDGDVIVLTNSILLNYNFSENKFYDTKKSLSQSVTTDIENIITQMFQAYLPILQSGIKNVFENYQTLAKNYSDNNNVGITNAVNQTSVFSPFIQGVTSNVGISIDNHKYFGLSTNINTEGSDNTIVFGNIVKYYKLLMNTINTDGSQTLTSDYAPGINNIPSAIFMQDTYNNGLLFGYKDKPNLKRFGSIFKNEEDELVIKSDAGKLAVDFSVLKIHKNYLRYNKLAQFNDSIEISHNLFLGGHYESGLINSGKFAYKFDPNGYDEYGTDSSKIIAIGSDELYGSAVQIRGDKINFPAQKSRALVTNSKGDLDTHIVENTIITDNIFGTTWSPLQEITTGVSTKRILTTYYYNYIVRKLNFLFNNYLNGLYWTKADFNNNVIPQLKLNDNFSVDNNASLASVANFNRQYSRINFSSEELNVDSTKISFKKYPKKVLVLDDTSLMRNDVEILTTQLPVISNIIQQNIPSLTISPIVKLITDRQLQSLIDYFNSLKTNIADNYWTKTQFLNFEIPNLTLNTGLFSRKYLAVNKTLNANGIYTQFKTDDNTLFLVDSDDNTINLGGKLGAQTISLKAPHIKFYDYFDGALTTDSNGKLYASQLIGTIQQNNFTSTYGNQLLSQVTRTLPDNKTIGSIVLAIVNNYNNLKSYIDSQISTLSASFTTQLNNLANQLNQQITIINGDIANIYNVLNTKADITYVDGITGAIITNVNNLENIVNQHQIDIDWIKAQLLTKVNLADFNNLVAEFNDFKSKIPKMPKGIICLWEGKLDNLGQLTASIPEDWEEVTSLRGRVPVGFLNNDYSGPFYGTSGYMFNTMGEIGGTVTHTLTVNEMPSHDHSVEARSGIGGSVGSEPWEGVNVAGNKTGLTGGNAPHNNTQPYKVVIFIRSTKGWEVNVTPQIPPAPTASSPQNFTTMQTVTINDLVAYGQNLKWYINNTTTTPLNSTTPIINGTTYYVSQTVGGQESPRTAVLVQINQVTQLPAPTGPSIYYGMFGESLQELIWNNPVQDINGDSITIKGYNTASSLSPLNMGLPLINNKTYYFTQTINGQESLNRLAVTTVLT